MRTRLEEVSPVLRLLWMGRQRFSAPQNGQTIAEFALVLAPIAVAVAFVLAALILSK